MSPLICSKRFLGSNLSHFITFFFILPLLYITLWASEKQKKEGRKNKKRVEIESMEAYPWFKLQFVEEKVKKSRVNVENVSYVIWPMVRAKPSLENKERQIEVTTEGPWWGPLVPHRQEFLT